ncbi:response regulator [Candidatus Microgenomates bacterium]|nr:MAG: response regulator [Candidatus Microgenomates bacterium]
MNQKIILIVENDLGIRNLLRLILEELGLEKFRGLFANNLEEARARLNRELKAPDLIFLDPDFNQSESLLFLKELKQENSKFKNIPVTIISTKESNESKKLWQENGSNSFITKPFDVSTIENLIINNH